MQQPAAAQRRLQAGAWGCSCLNPPSSLPSPLPSVQAINPQDEVLAAKRQGQELECDLTGGDEEAPEWRAAKRPAISLA